LATTGLCPAAPAELRDWPVSRSSAGVTHGYLEE
jgi:hypothetical protein